MVIAAATVVTYPLRVYRALLAGLQDVVFNGALGIAEASIIASVTIIMLVKGYGIYALACAAAAASIFGTIAGAIRASYIAPDLVGDTEFIGNVIYQSVGVANNVPFAAAYAIVPALIMAAYLLIARQMKAFEAL